MIRPCVAKSFFLNKCLQKCSKFTRNLNITMRVFSEMKHLFAQEVRVFPSLKFTPLLKNINLQRQMSVAIFKVEFRKIKQFSS